MNFLRNLFGGSEDRKASQSGAHRYPEASPASATQNSNPKRVKLRPPTPQPLLEDTAPGAQGGVQGLDWYHSSLQRDAEGDVAQHFMGEASPHGAAQSAAPGAFARQRTVAAGPSRLVVNAGDVVVVPHDSSGR